MKKLASSRSGADHRFSQRISKQEVPASSAGGPELVQGGLVNDAAIFCPVCSGWDIDTPSGCACDKERESAASSGTGLVQDAMVSDEAFTCPVCGEWNSDGPPERLIKCKCSQMRELASSSGRNDHQPSQRIFKTGHVHLSTYALNPSRVHIQLRKACKRSERELQTGNVLQLVRPTNQRPLCRQLCRAMHPRTYWVCQNRCLRELHHVGICIFRCLGLAREIPYEGTKSMARHRREDVILRCDFCMREAWDACIYCRRNICPWHHAADDPARCWCCV